MNAQYTDIIVTIIVVHAPELKRLLFKGWPAGCTRRVSRLAKVPFVVQYPPPPPAHLRIWEFDEVLFSALGDLARSNC